MYLDANLHEANRSAAYVQRRRLLRAADVRLLCFALLAILDFVILLTALFLTVGPGPTVTANLPLSSSLILAAAYPFIAFSFGAYSHEAITSIASACSAATKGYGASLLFAVYPALLYDALAQTFGWDLVLAFMAAYATTCIVHVAFVQFVHRFLHERVLTRIFVDDADEKVSALKGYVTIDARQTVLEPNLADPDMLARIGTALSGVDRIVVHCPIERREAWAMVLKGLGVDGFILAPELASLGIRDADLRTGAAFLAVSKGPLDLRNRVLKRLLDLAICIPLLIVLAIPMLLIAIAIRVESPGAALFTQSRIGQHNNTFQILKFRSMRAEVCDAAGQRSTSRDDDRITPLGAWLRRTSIDELPQLINVLHGEMSLVGPRPHASASRAENKLFWEIDSRYFVRHSVKPGITGLAQVSGLRGATQSTDDLVQRLRADLSYSSNWSVWVDLSILLRTFGVLTHKNAY